MLPDEHGVFHSLILPGFGLRLVWLWQAPAPSALGTLLDLGRANPTFADAVRRSLG